MEMDCDLGDGFKKKKKTKEEVEMELGMFVVVKWVECVVSKKALASHHSVSKCTCLVPPFRLPGFFFLRLPLPITKCSLAGAPLDRKVPGRAAGVVSRRHRF